jgi:hypothetical protein
VSDRGRRHRHQRIAPSRWHDNDTQMSRAFLAALARWVTEHHADPGAQITLPTGVVSAGELTLVLRALEVARSQSSNNPSSTAARRFARIQKRT